MARCAEKCGECKGCVRSAKKSESDRRRRSTPEGKAKQAEYNATPEARASQAESYRRRRTTPEGKARVAERDRRYLATAEGKAKKSESDRRRRATPEDKAKRAESDRRYRATPEAKASADAAFRRWRATTEGRAKIAAKGSARRARKLGAFVERVDRTVVWERDGGICYWCETPADPDNFHVDHVKPLSKGGTEEYANVAVTHPTCNLSKYDWWIEPTRIDLPLAVAA